jgi:uncharacterized sulfatase
MPITRRAVLAGAPGLLRAQTRRPNILFAIADDQSWLDAGAYGNPAVRTPPSIEWRVPASCSGMPSVRASARAHARGALTGRNSAVEKRALRQPLSQEITVYPDVLMSTATDRAHGQGRGTRDFRTPGWPQSSRFPDERRVSQRAEGINANTMLPLRRLQARLSGRPFCLVRRHGAPSRLPTRNRLSLGEAR